MKNSKIFLRGRVVLIGIVVSISTTVLVVYITGVPSHRSLVDNSLISLITLSTMFFCFLTIGLYYGLHIEDDLSNKLKLSRGKSAILSNGTSVPETPGSFEVGDGFTGILLSIALWLVVSILFILFLVLLEFVIWAGIIGLTGLIYWVLMRALKLVFTNSLKCRNNLSKSLFYAFNYTLLYLGWIYGVIYISLQFS